MGRIIFLALIAFCWSLSASAQQLYKLTLLDSISVEFKFGTTDVINLDVVKNKILDLNKGKGNDVKVIINSYTDTVGTLKFNQNLAEKRLQKVIDLYQIFSKFNTPIISNNINEDRFYQIEIDDSLYRRADILVYEYKLNAELNKPYPLQINFVEGTAVPRKNAKEIMDEIAFVLKKDVSLNIELHGHISGNDPDYELSLNRALRVKKYLVDSGINEERIVCKGMSNKHKLYPETSEENKALNRRVEIILSHNE